MKTTQKPLMIAYLIFLCICIIYHAITSALNVSFSSWDKIVLAATSASFAFSASALYKSFIGSNKKYFDLIEEYVCLAKEEHCLDNEYFPENEELLNCGKKVIKKAIDTKMHLQRRIRILGTVTFWLDIIGYLTFFCILVFEPLKEVLFDSQGTITIAAFSMVLLVEILEDWYADLLKKAYITLIEGTKETIKEMKDRNNG